MAVFALEERNGQGGGSTDIYGWIFSFRDPVLFTFFGCTELKPPFSLAFAHQLKNGRVCCVVVRQLISSDAGGL